MSDIEEDKGWYRKGLSSQYREVVYDVKKVDG